MNIKVDEAFLKKSGLENKIKGMIPIKIVKQDWMGTQIRYAGLCGEFTTIIVPTNKVQVEG